MTYPKRSQYKHAKKKKYHVRNGADYNESLRRRGDLTVWFDEDAIAAWEAEQRGKPGGRRKYSDVAIETGLVVRMIYGLGYRQAQGFLASIVSFLELKIRPRQKPTESSNRPTGQFNNREPRTANGS